MRRALDLLYAISLGLAALAICLIVVLVTTQVTLNVVARVMGPGWSRTIPSYVDFAGYLLAAASFLALAPALTGGSHIRVTLALRRLPDRLQSAIESLSLVAALGVAGFALWFLVNLTLESLRFGDTSTGILAIPLWIPQAAMATGLGVLVIALADALVQTLRATGPILKGGEEA